jgi:hypothetical protein
MIEKMQKVQVIAALFIIMGVIAWWESYNSLIDESVLSIGLEMILLPAGVGLLKRSERWRRVSINLTVLFLVVALLQPVLIMVVGPTVRFSMLGRSIQPDSVLAIAYMLTYTGIFLISMLWIYRGLQDPEVKRAFAASTEETE